MGAIYLTTKRNVYSSVFHFFRVISAISFITFCSLIIYQFMPENSFGSVQIRVSNQSSNKGRVKIELRKCCNIKYGHDLRADTLSTVDNFIEGNFTLKTSTKRENLNVYVSCFVGCVNGVQRVSARMVAILNIEIFVTFDIYPSLITRLITDSNLDRT